jgi:hypothetical protein
MVSVLKGKDEVIMALLNKGYLKFFELMERWSISEVDIFHLIAEGKLFPSIFLNTNLDAYEFDERGMQWELIYSKDDLDHVEDEDELNTIYEMTKVKGFYYLRFNRESLDELAAFEVQIELPHFKGNLKPRWGLCDTSCTLTYGDNCFSIESAVFESKEIERCERENKIGGSYVESSNLSKFDQEKSLVQNLEKTLQDTRKQLTDSQRTSEALQKSLAILQKEIIEGKAKNTALHLIGGLVMGAYSMDIHAKKLSGLSEIVDDLARLGISITSETVSAWIKDAAQIIANPHKY